MMQKLNTAPERRENSVLHQSLMTPDSITQKLILFTKQIINPLGTFLW